MDDAGGGKRLMGLDVGQKTIGVAVSDPLGLTAQGVTVVRRSDPARDLEALRSIVEEYGVGEVVVGLPIRTDGAPGPEAASVEEFMELLRRALGLPVAGWDERFTTAQAQRLMIDAGVSRSKRRAKIDMVAAAIILQGFIDRRAARGAS